MWIRFTDVNAVLTFLCFFLLNSAAQHLVVVVSTNTAKP